MKTAPRCAVHASETLANDIKTPDETSRAMSVPADAAFQPCQYAQREEAIEDADTSSGGGSLRCVTYEEDAPYLAARSEAVAIDEPDDLPVAFAQAATQIAEISSAGATGLGHRDLLNRTDGGSGESRP